MKLNENKYEQKFKSLNKKLEKATKDLASAIEESDNSFVLRKKIKKNIKKLKKITAKEHEQRIELENKISDLNHQWKKVNDREKHVFFLLKKIEKNIHDLDVIYNHWSIKILTFDKKNAKHQKILSNLNDSSKLERKINKEKKKIESKKELLSKNSKNFAIKLEIYKIKNKLKSLEKEQRVLAKTDKKILNKKIKKNKEFKKENKEVLNKVGKLLDSFLELRTNAKNALSVNDKIKKLKSFIIEDLDIFYGKKQALFGINMEIPKNKVIAIIGPSGCGKSTFLRTLNRINDEIADFYVRGKILLDGEYDIYKLHSIRNKFDKIEITTLRTKVGMIFQHPNPFPMSIYKNVSYGPRINGIKNKAYLNDIVKNSLIRSALWDEVKDNLNVIATSLSGGQQQRLCIARAIANNPEILLMDEPTSALDPIAASKIESLILELKKEFTIIMVTHSLQQAARIADYTAFFYNGKLIEFRETEKLFSEPKRKRTAEYVEGKFG